MGFDRRSSFRIQSALGSSLAETPTVQDPVLANRVGETAKCLPGPRAETRAGHSHCLTIEGQDCRYHRLFYNASPGGIRLRGVVHGAGFVAWLWSHRRWHPPATSIRICLHPCLRSDMPMTNLEIRVAALQFLSLRLCAALSLGQLEDIRRSTLDGVRASDVESLQMQTEFLKLLDDAIDRARQKQAAAAKTDSVHLA